MKVGGGKKPEEGSQGKDRSLRVHDTGLLRKVPGGGLHPASVKAQQTVEA